MGLTEDSVPMLASLRCCALAVCGYGEARSRPGNARIQHCPAFSRAELALDTLRRSLLSVPPIAERWPSSIFGFQTNPR